MIRFSCGTEPFLCQKVSSWRVAVSFCTFRQRREICLAHFEKVPKLLAIINLPWKIYQHYVLLEISFLLSLTRMFFHSVLCRSSNYTSFKMQYEFTSQKNHVTIITGIYYFFVYLYIIYLSLKCLFYEVRYQLTLSYPKDNWFSEIAL